MDEKSFLQWLKNNDLFDYCRDNLNLFIKVLKESLKAKDEDLLVVGDLGTKNRRICPILVGGYLLAGKELNLRTSVAVQEIKSQGDAAERGVVKAFENLKTASLIATSTSFRLGSLRHLGKSYRTFAILNSHRFISTSGVGSLTTDKLQPLLDTFDVGYEKLKERCDFVHDQLEFADNVHITTENGTDLSFGIGSRIISLSGSYSTSGSGGNMPAGEVYLSQRDSDVNGKVVVDGSSRNKNNTLIVDKPFTLKIERGVIKEIIGEGEAAAALKKSLEWAELRAEYPERIRRVCELGIGLNPKADIVGCMIIDEKAKGTAHIGIGSNYWFGGDNRTIMHLDQLFKNPKIQIDGKDLKV